MFKIEVMINGEKKHRYFMNKHKDDFIQFLPRIFMQEYGEEISISDISIFKIDESKMPLLEGRLRQHGSNGLAYEDGKILIKRTDKSKFKDGDEVTLERYLEESAKRDEVFTTAKEKKLKVKAPKTFKKDIDDGQGGLISVDMVLIDSTEDLLADVESLELELTGVKLKQWPYDDKGKFLGNK